MSDEQLNELIDWIKALSERVLALELAAIRSQCIPEALVKSLRRGYERYETARRMTPNQWADAWARSISTGQPFDEIIDDMREAGLAEEAK